MSTLKEACEILGVTINTPLFEIKKKYRILILKDHPNKTKDDPVLTDKLKKINEAYDLIYNYQIDGIPTEESSKEETDCKKCRVLSNSYNDLLDEYNSLLQKYNALVKDRAVHN